MGRPLRVFLCCLQSPHQYKVAAYSFWPDYFRRGLAEAEWTAVEAPECDWAQGLLPPTENDVPAWRERTWAKAMDVVRREHAHEPIDLFLSYLFPQQVLPSAIAEIRALGIPCVNFFCDNVREFRRVPDEYACFDLHWVPENDAIALYKAAKLPYIHAAMPCWVPPAQRLPVERESRPITFTGGRDEEREKLFAEVLSLGLRVDLCGPGWISQTEAPAPARARDPRELARRQWEFARRVGWMGVAHKISRSLRPPPRCNFDFTPYAKGPQFGDQYWPTLRESIVCLGVNRYPTWYFSKDRPRTYSRLRDIEAPMAGACYLTEWAPGLDQMYDIGNEVETYRTGAELAEKARALSADGPRRKKLRQNAQRRALNYHSIARTLGRIAERLGCHS